nr:hypothetical protein [Providencia rettgeri]
MNAEQFIEKNVQAELKKLGFSLSIAQMASNMALDHYRKSSQASRKGRLFDDCLNVAKAWAIKYSGGKKKWPSKRKKQYPFSSVKYSNPLSTSGQAELKRVDWWL